MKRYTCAIALLFPLFVHSQIILDVDSPPDECVEVLLNNTLDFERGTTCSADVVILDEDNIEIFRTDELAFSYTFDELGTFTIYCGAGATAVAMRSLCVNASVIPTLSEWSVICLMLILMIVGVSSLKQGVVMHEVALAE